MVVPQFEPRVHLSIDTDLLMDTIDVLLQPTQLTDIIDVWLQPLDTFVSCCYVILMA